MSITRFAIVASAIALAAAAPANATWGGSSSRGGSSYGGSTSSGGTSTSSGGTQVPEPADFALFAMGVAGLLIGRRTSRKRRSQSDET